MTDSARPARRGSVRALGRAVFAQQEELELSLVAAGVALWLIVALFPASLATVNLLGLVAEQAVVARWVTRFVEFLPGSLDTLLAEQLQSVAAPSPGTFIPDTVLVLVCLWSVSSATGNLITGIRRSYGLPRRPLLHRRLRALAVGIGGVLALGALGFLVAAMTVLGHWLVDLAVLMAIGLLIGALHLVAVDRPWRLRTVLPGAALTTVCLAGLGVGFDLYVAVSGNLSAIYGAVAGAIVAMVAVWLAVYAVLVGAVLNAELAGAPTDPDQVIPQ